MLDFYSNDIFTAPDSTGELKTREHGRGMKYHTCKPLVMKINYMVENEIRKGTQKRGRDKDKWRGLKEN